MITPETLAFELGVSAKRVRAFLRGTFPRAAAEKGRKWNLTAPQVVAVVRRFTRVY